MTDVVNSQELTDIQLFAGDFPRVTKAVTIASGQGELAAGTVLGKITASGEYGAYDNTNNDGTETAKLILKETIDATSAAVKCNAYVTGCFDKSALTGIDAAGLVDFEGTPIIIKDNVV